MAVYQGKKLLSYEGIQYGTSGTWFGQGPFEYAR